MANRIVESERGRGWQAISIAIGFDRREAIPAFAVFEWAPGGDWEKAEEGDARTWEGYSFRAEFQQKIETPTSCTPPSTEAFIYEEEFNAAAETEDDEDPIFKNIARRHRVSADKARRLVQAVEQWSFC